MLTVERDLVKCRLLDFVAVVIAQDIIVVSGNGP
jgi:hypothetical protein